MDIPMRALTLVNQEPALPDNNQEIIQMLGLGGYSDVGSSNTGKLVDDIVRNLDLDAFTLTPSAGAPTATIGFESVLGHQQQVLGSSLGAYQPTETISYVDLSPPGIENSPYSPYHVSGGSLFNNEAYSLPGFPQEISSFVPATPVGAQDTRRPAGGKTTRRRRELKVKLYEREEPLSDPEEEKKRQNAINAKKNRDKHNLKLKELEDIVKTLTAERDALQPTNTNLRNKCDAFERQLKTVCQQFNVPVIILPQD